MEWRLRYSWILTFDLRHYRLNCWACVPPPEDGSWWRFVSCADCAVTDDVPSQGQGIQCFYSPRKICQTSSVLPLFDLACGGKALLKNVQSQVQRFAACQRQRRPTAAVAVELWLACWCTSSKINDKRHIPLGQNIDTCHHVQKGNPWFFSPILLSLLKQQPGQLPLLAQPWKIRCGSGDALRVKSTVIAGRFGDLLGHPGTSWDHVQHGAVHTRLCKSNLPDPCRVAAQCWMRADESCDSWIMDCEWAHVMNWIKKGSVGQHGAIISICPGISHRIMEQSVPFRSLQPGNNLTCLSLFVQTWHFPTYCSPTSAAMSCDELFSPIRTPKRRGHRRRLSHRQRNMFYQCATIPNHVWYVFRQSNSLNWNFKGMSWICWSSTLLMLLNKATHVSRGSHHINSWFFFSGLQLCSFHDTWNAKLRCVVFSHMLCSKTFCRTVWTCFRTGTHSTLNF